MADNGTNGRFFALYGVSALAAVIADGLTRLPTRPWFVAVLGVAPAVLLGRRILGRRGGGTRRAGRLPFGLAMVCAVVGVIAGCGSSRSEALVGFGMIVAASLALVTAYVRVMFHRRNRRNRPSVRSVVFPVAPMLMIIAFCVMGLLSTGPTNCDSDDCVWNSLSVYIDVVVACECLMLCVVVVAFRAATLAGLGMLLAVAGLHLLAELPFSGQSQSIVGAELLCGGFLLAARPWLTPDPAAIATAAPVVRI